MSTILDKYGIKEVADVTFYDLDSTGAPTFPILYLDTLKVSTIEQTAEQAEARGGKGNTSLIIWDFGKEISVTLEDALFSSKSMAIMFGDGRVKDADGGAPAELLKTIPVTWTTTIPATFEMAGRTIALPSDGVYYNADGTTGTIATGAYYTFDLPVTAVGQIEISANSFPGTYYVTGDTFARSEANGKDEFFQFIIPKAKMNAENTITLEAEGDPSVFNMSLRVMRPADGKMMKLVKYDVTDYVAPAG